MSEEDIEEYEPTEKSAPHDRDEAGPLDEEEAPVRPYIDLGGLKVVPRKGMQMRLEVEEKTKRVVAATLQLGESAVQLQGFAAPRSEGIWRPVREVLTESLKKQGAKVSEEEGALGPELRAEIPAGEKGKRNVRILGVDGPRWMLQGLITGKAGSDEAEYERMIEVFRATVVVRGQQPMPPRDLLPLKAPTAPETAKQ
ncbi:MAG TPA: DUF3710 domain-containing protein [Candidatus Agrococcus pullicola]|uniref:DUF3710 domain-containing protein n=1 Tax=Candidatus Agrococcus pullicola TaxID=2838429 RepID=A0A9D1YVE4_9MICO|nr:DUF3710 domain-containing protein [Candidatus Agrococcus pullicola]